VLTFQFCDFLTGNAALHTRNGTAASWRDWCIAINTENTGNTRLPIAGGVDMALAFFLNTQLYEVH
jgi:uncharacterized membrane protein YbhN (UPF0104 family)